MSDGQLVLIPTNPDFADKLGRTGVWHDPKNRAHRALLLGAEPMPDRSICWLSTDVFDQQGPSCTFQSFTGVCRTKPFRPTFAQHWPLFDTEEERHAGYLASQPFDPWWPHPHDGSSTDAPFKYARSIGIINGWKHLFGVHEAKQWVMYRGPFSTGTNWYESMFEVDRSGFIRIVDRFGISGGHAWRIIGYSKHRRAFRLINSWGRDWGQGGRAWIREDDFARLLAEDGECVTVDQAQFALVA